MTVRVIVDANSLHDQHSPNIVTTQLSRAENNMTFNSQEDILTKLYQAAVNIVVHRNTSHFLEFQFNFAFI